MCHTPPLSHIITFTYNSPIRYCLRHVQREFSDGYTMERLRVSARKIIWANNELSLISFAIASMIPNIGISWSWSISSQRSLVTTISTSRSNTVVCAGLMSTPLLEGGGSLCWYDLCAYICFICFKPRIARNSWSWNHWAGNQSGSKSHRIQSRGSCWSRVGFLSSFILSSETDLKSFFSAQVCSCLECTLCKTDNEN